MRTSTKAMIVFFMLGVFLAGVFVLTSRSLATDRCFRDASRDLFVASEKKVNMINDLLSQMDDDVRMIVENGEVKKLFEQELVFDEFVIMRDVDRKAEIISKEVENYIRAFPDMTLEDLRGSSEFRSVAIQPIGGAGYSAIEDYEEQVIVLHKFDEFVGKGLEIGREELPEIYDLRVRSKSEIEVFGFYDWRDVDGEMRRKYAKLIHIKARTADGIGLMVVTTAYVDDYKVVSDSSKEIKDYLESFDYYHLALVSPDGHVIYGAKQEGVVGTNLEWVSSFDIGISKNYLKSKESESVSFHGPFIGIYGDVYPKVSVTAPVFENGVLLGFVIVVDNMNDVFDVSEKVVGMSESQESYLIDNTGLLISPLRSGEFDIMVQSIESKNFGNCFDETFSEYSGGRGPVDYFLNYKGEEVIGVHREIADINWCLLTEVAADEVLTIPVNESVKRSIYFSILGLFVWVLIEFSVKFYLGKGKLFAKKKALVVVW